MSLNIIIDFDSTFVKVEAFDELATISLANHHESSKIINEIKNITNLGMEGKISISESLDYRIKLLHANVTHIDTLVARLKQQITISFVRNKDFIKNHAQNIYIVSSGFKEYIIPVASEYGIDESHVYANTFSYDDTGNITGIDNTNLLCQELGKVKCVSNLGLSGEIHVIGDGYTDYEIKQQGVATKFYAFIENIKRDAVISVAECIIPNFDEFLFQNKLPMALSYPKNRIKILLLENIHPVALKLLCDEGYTVETHKGAMNENELCKKIKGVSILGIRSKTNVTKKVLEYADRLMAIGAFCIGTNQIDLKEATKHGVCVFNAPYSNTRSVVELAIGEIIMLMRKAVAKNTQMHQGIWDKSADNCFEIRGKALGIIGYGNIGSQLSVLAENLGMKVYYYDLVERLPLSNVKKCDTLDELLKVSDVVTLHVDGAKSNANFIGEHEFALMKQNSVFINLSRGHVVDISALVKYIKLNKFLGVAIDVYPKEPKNNDEKFINELCGFDNVILTPHIGGSTQEAQYSIGDFVAKRVTNYINTGDTMQSVNFPNVQLPILNDAHRLIHLHANVPGILAQINNLFAKHQINVLWQSLRTNEEVGYIITDINKTFDNALIEELKKVSNTLKFRVLY